MMKTVLLINWYYFPNFWHAGVNLPSVVLSSASWNWPLTNRNTRLDFPTDASPRRTNLQWSIRRKPGDELFAITTCRCYHKDIFLVTVNVFRWKRIISTCFQCSQAQFCYRQSSFTCRTVKSEFLVINFLLPLVCTFSKMFYSTVRYWQFVFQ